VIVNNSSLWLTSEKECKTTKKDLGGFDSDVDELQGIDLDDFDLDIDEFLCIDLGDFDSDVHEYDYMNKRMQDISVVEVRNDKGEAKRWLTVDPTNSITSWDDLAKMFLARFFPSGKGDKLRSEILDFR
ncbi:hypothetical protein MTR67_003251, partial [Solanum verrucosum]